MHAFLRTLAFSVPALRRLRDDRDRLSQQLTQARSEISGLRGGTFAEPDEQDIPGRLADLERRAGALRASFDTPASPAGASGLQILAGTPYARYAVPVEYLPSRDFRPRWGHAKPPIPALEQWFRAHADEYRTLLGSMRDNARHLKDIPLEFSEANLPLPAWSGVPYCPFDAVALYTMIRTHAPKRYLEIGSGITTCFARKAIVDGGLRTQITSIDPEPRAKIDTICDAIIRDGLETCDLSIFDALEPGDILFFDGSHRSFMNSDVTVFFIDVLPRIKPGVIVHIHDIALPWDYDDFFKLWYWNETYLLAVYLMGRMDRIRPIAPTAFMCRAPEFESFFVTPMLDLGTHNDGWRGGGAMWFTHTE